MVDHAWSHGNHWPRGGTHHALVLPAHLGTELAAHFRLGMCAGFPWLLMLVESQVRFLLRRIADYFLCDLAGHKKGPGRLTAHLRA